MGMSVYVKYCNFSEFFIDMLQHRSLRLGVIWVQKVKSNRLKTLLRDAILVFVQGFTHYGLLFGASLPSLCPGQCYVPTNCFQLRKEATDTLKKCVNM